MGITHGDETRIHHADAHEKVSVTYFARGCAAQSGKSSEVSQLANVMDADSEGLRCYTSYAAAAKKMF